MKIDPKAEQKISLKNEMDSQTDSVAQVNLKKLRPYGDIMDDGTVQLAFTLPVEASAEAREAAVLLTQKMGFEQIKVATMEKAAHGFSFFVIYARLKHTVDFTQIKVLKVEAKKRSREEIDEIIRTRIGRKLVVLGACTGYDAHTVGIDAIINMKGFAGDYGLERYHWLDARNLGAQVQNDDLLRLAIEQKADAILVSKVVSQHNIHIRDMKDLIQRAEKLGIRDQFILVAGGPRVTHPMALECGLDAGFGVGTMPSDVASYIVEEYLKRNGIELSEASPDHLLVGEKNLGSSSESVDEGHTKLPKSQDQRKRTLSVKGSGREDLRSGTSSKKKKGL